MNRLPSSLWTFPFILRMVSNGLTRNSNKVPVKVCTNRSMLITDAIIFVVCIPSTDHIASSRFYILLYFVIFDSIPYK